MIIGSYTMQTLEVDTLICGGGMSGMACAAFAAEAGAKFLVVERQEEVGGSSNLSVGMLYVDVLCYCITIHLFLPFLLFMLTIGQLGASYLRTAEILGTKRRSRSAACIAGGLLTGSAITYRQCNGCVRTGFPPQAALTES